MNSGEILAFPLHRDGRSRWLFFVEGCRCHGRAHRLLCEAEACGRELRLFSERMCSSRSFPIPRGAIVDTQRPPRPRESFFPPEVGEEVAFVLDMGPSRGSVRTAKIMTLTTRMMFVRLRVEVEPEDAIEKPFLITAPWDGNQEPGTWHRP